MNQQRRITNILFHTIPWLVILFLGPFSFVFWEDVDTHLQRRALLIFSAFLLSFYFNYFILIPKLLFKRKFIIYGAIAISFIILAAFLNKFVHETFHLSRIRPALNHSIKDQLPPIFLPMGIVMLFGFGIAEQMTKRWLAQDKVHQEIMQEQLKTELAFLKNQVSPHFFFNTLNNIYALIEINSEQAREVTHKLSKLMRYLLYESEKGKTVTLGREITFLKTYIELMEIRLPENVSLSFEHGSEHDNSQVSPLLFVPFVENAFKHGISFQEKCKINITLQNRDGNIEFSVINTIPAVSEGHERKGGLGLSNIKRRLELLYGKGKYQLDISVGEKIYDVRLKLPAHED